MYLMTIQYDRSPPMYCCVVYSQIITFFSICLVPYVWFWLECGNAELIH